MSDTTTILNPSAGGDVLGESQARQPDLASPTSGGTLVKMPRVVAADDDGRLLAPTVSEEMGRQILLELRGINNKLAIMIGHVPIGEDFSG